MFIFQLLQLIFILGIIITINIILPTTHAITTTPVILTDEQQHLTTKQFLDYADKDNNAVGIIKTSGVENAYFSGTFLCLLCSSTGFVSITPYVKELYTYASITFYDETQRDPSTTIRVQSHSGTLNGQVDFGHFGNKVLSYYGVLSFPKDLPIDVKIQIKSKLTIIHNAVGTKTEESIIHRWLPEYNNGHWFDFPLQQINTNKAISSLSRRNIQDDDGPVFQRIIPQLLFTNFTTFFGFVGFRVELVGTLQFVPSSSVDSLIHTCYINNYPLSVNINPLSDSKALDIILNEELSFIALTRWYNTMIKIDCTSAYVLKYNNELASKIDNEWLVLYQLSQFDSIVTSYNNNNSTGSSDSKNNIDVGLDDFKAVGGTILIDLNSYTITKPIQVPTLINRLSYLAPYLYTTIPSLINDHMVKDQLQHYPYQFDKKRPDAVNHPYKYRQFYTYRSSIVFHNIEDFFKPFELLIWFRNIQIPSVDLMLLSNDVNSTNNNLKGSTPTTLPFFIFTLTPTTLQERQDSTTQVHLVPLFNITQRVSPPQSSFDIDSKPEYIVYSTPILIKKGLASLYPSNAVFPAAFPSQPFSVDISITFPFVNGVRPLKSNQPYNNLGNNVHRYSLKTNMTTPSQQHPSKQQPSQHIKNSDDDDDIVELLTAIECGFIFSHIEESDLNTNSISKSSTINHNNTLSTDNITTTNNNINANNNTNNNINTSPSSKHFVSHNTTIHLVDVNNNLEEEEQHDVDNSLNHIVQIPNNKSQNDQQLVQTTTNNNPHFYNNYVITTSPTYEIENTYILAQSPGYRHNFFDIRIKNMNRFIFDEMLLELPFGLSAFNLTIPPAGLIDYTGQPVNPMQCYLYNSTSYFAKFDYKKLQKDVSITTYRNATLFSPQGLDKNVQYYDFRLNIFIKQIDSSKISFSISDTTSKTDQEDWNAELFEYMGIVCPWVSISFPFVQLHDWRDVMYQKYNNNNNNNNNSTDINYIQYNGLNIMNMTYSNEDLQHIEYEYEPFVITNEFYQKISLGNMWYFTFYRTMSVDPDDDDNNGDKNININDTIMKRVLIATTMMHITPTDENIDFIWIFVFVGFISFPTMFVIIVGYSAITYCSDTYMSRKKDKNNILKDGLTSSSSTSSFHRHLSNDSVESIESPRAHLLINSSPIPTTRTNSIDSYTGVVDDDDELAAIDPSLYPIGDELHNHRFHRRMLKKRSLRTRQNRIAGYPYNDSSSTFYPILIKIWSIIKYTIKYIGFYLCCCNCKCRYLLNQADIDIIYEKKQFFYTESDDEDLIESYLQQQMLIKLTAQHKQHNDYLENYDYSQSQTIPYDMNNVIRNGESVVLINSGILNKNKNNKNDKTLLLKQSNSKNNNDNINDQNINIKTISTLSTKDNAIVQQQQQQPENLIKSQSNIKPNQLVRDESTLGELPNTVYYNNNNNNNINKNHKSTRNIHQHNNTTNHDNGNNNNQQQQPLYYDPILNDGVARIDHIEVVLTEYAQSTVYQQSEVASIQGINNKHNDNSILSQHDGSIPPQNHHGKSFFTNNNITNNNNNKNNNTASGNNNHGQLAQSSQLTSPDTPRYPTQDLGFKTPFQNKRQFNTNQQQYIYSNNNDSDDDDGITSSIDARQQQHGLFDTAVKAKQNNKNNFNSNAVYSSHFDTITTTNNHPHHHQQQQSSTPSSFQHNNTNFNTALGISSQNNKNMDAQQISKVKKTSNNDNDNNTNRQFLPPTKLKAPTPSSPFLGGGSGTPRQRAASTIIQSTDLTGSGNNNLVRLTNPNNNNNNVSQSPTALLTPNNNNGKNSNNYDDDLYYSAIPFDYKQHQQQQQQQNNTQLLYGLVTNVTPQQSKLQLAFNYSSDNLHYNDNNTHDSNNDVHNSSTLYNDDDDNTVQHNLPTIKIVGLEDNTMMSDEHFSDFSISLKNNNNNNNNNTNNKVNTLSSSEFDVNLVHLYNNTTDSFNNQMLSSADVNNNNNNKLNDNDDNQSFYSMHSAFETAYGDREDTTDKRQNAMNVEDTSELTVSKFSSSSSPSEVSSSSSSRHSFSGSDDESRMSSIDNCSSYSSKSKRDKNKSTHNTPEKQQKQQKQHGSNNNNMVYLAGSVVSGGMDTLDILTNTDVTLSCISSSQMTNVTQYHDVSTQQQLQHNATTNNTPVETSKVMNSISFTTTPATATTTTTFEQSDSFETPLCDTDRSTSAPMIPIIIPMTSKSQNKIDVSILQAKKQQKQQHLNNIAQQPAALSMAGSESSSTQTAYQDIEDSGANNTTNHDNNNNNNKPNHSQNLQSTNTSSTLQQQQPPPPAIAPQIILPQKYKSKQQQQQHQQQTQVDHQYYYDPNNGPRNNILQSYQHQQLQQPNDDNNKNNNSLQQTNLQPSTSSHLLTPGISFSTTTSAITQQQQKRVPMPQLSSATTNNINNKPNLKPTSSGHVGYAGYVMSPQLHPAHVNGNTVGSTTTPHSLNIDSYIPQQQQQKQPIDKKNRKK